MATEVMCKQLGMRMALACAQGATLLSDFTTQRVELGCRCLRDHRIELVLVDGTASASGRGGVVFGVAKMGVWLVLKRLAELSRIR